MSESSDSKAVVDEVRQLIEEVLTFHNVTESLGYLTGLVVDVLTSHSAAFNDGPLYRRMVLSNMTGVQKLDPNTVLLGDMSTCFVRAYSKGDNNE